MATKNTLKYDTPTTTPLAGGAAPAVVGLAADKEGKLVVINNKIADVLYWLPADEVPAGGTSLMFQMPANATIFLSDRGYPAQAIYFRSPTAGEVTATRAR